MELFQNLIFDHLWRAIQYFPIIGGWFVAIYFQYRSGVVDLSVDGRIVCCGVIWFLLSSTLGEGGLKLGLLGGFLAFVGCFLVSFALGSVVAFMRERFGAQELLVGFGLYFALAEMADVLLTSNVGRRGVDLPGPSDSLIALSILLCVVVFGSVLLSELHAGSRLSKVKEINVDFYTSLLGRRSYRVEIFHSIVSALLLTLVTVTFAETSRTLSLGVTNGIGFLALLVMPYAVRSKWILFGVPLLLASIYPLKDGSLFKENPVVWKLADYGIVMACVIGISVYQRSLFWIREKTS